MTAVILCGGMGTRLRSAFSKGPKVLAPVNGTPFLSFLLKQLAQASFRDVIICAGYKGDQIKNTFGESYEEVAIRYSYEVEPLGTGGAIHNSIHMVKTDNILVMNGDSYIDTNLTAYIEWFRKNNVIASLLLKPLNNTDRYGRVEVNKNKRVLSFKEKRTGLGQGLINAGVYIFQKSVVGMIPAGENYSLESQLLPKLVGKEIYGFHSEASFIDIGTPETYEQAESFFKNRF